jgi:F0F1-type ATP synthase assembly protein I
MAGNGGPPNPWRGWSTGFAISVYLLSAVVVWGGLGYLADRVVGTPNVFAVVGMVVGAAAGIYLIYLRYGRSDDEAS